MHNRNTHTKVRDLIDDINNNRLIRYCERIIAGPTGPAGSSDQITIRNTITSEPGTNAEVIDNTGSPNHILDFIIPAGNDGIIGPTGPRGIQGETGSTGPQGIQGEIGPTGPQGIQGETGSTGPQGIQGIQGEVGPIGPQGIQGEVGPTGHPLALQVLWEV